MQKKIKGKDTELIKINAQQPMDQVSFLGAGTSLHDHVIRGPELALSFVPMPSDNGFALCLFPHH